MAILTLPVAQAIVPEEYNGTGSITAFNYHPAIPALNTPQSIMAQVYLRGDGGGSLARVFSNENGSNVNGLRLNRFAGGRWGIGSSSSGISTAPFVESAVLATGAFYTLAGVLDGTIFNNNMHFYWATDAAPLALDDNISSSGSGTINSSVGNRLMIGNREDLARSHDGSIAFVAWWNRILSLPELWAAQFSGPLTVPGLAFFYANGRDWGPLDLAVAQRVAVGAPTRVLNGVIPPIMGRRKLFISVPAAASTTMVMDPLVFGGAI